MKRPDIAGLMEKLSYKPTTEANKVFGVLRKMFNLAEVWGYRPDGSNPCRHIQLFPAGKSTHLISDENLGKLFRQFDKIEAEGLENSSFRWRSACNPSLPAAVAKLSLSNGHGSIWRTGGSPGPTARPAACPSP